MLMPIARNIVEQLVLLPEPTRLGPNCNKYLQMIG